MSLIADIRAQMALESGPVHPRHLAEVLEEDVTTVRNTMNQAATKGHGIERLDDGKFSLIPGWAPARGPNAAADPAPAPAPEPPNQANTSAIATPAPRKTKAQGEPAKKKRAYKRRAPVKSKKALRVAKRKSSPNTKVARKLRVAVSAPALPGDTVLLSRTSLKALVTAVLDGEQEITPALRAALREATHQTAA